MQTRQMDEAGQQLEIAWINIHGAPSTISGYIEFFSFHFGDALRYFAIEFEPRPVRRHDKLDVVEQKNAVVRVLIQSFLKNTSNSSVCVDDSVERKDVVSRAVYLSKTFYGNKTLSSIEMTQCHTLLIVSLPQSKLSADLITAYNEQVARRALSLLDKSRSPQVLQTERLSSDDPVYYFKRSQVWLVGTRVRLQTTASLRCPSKASGTHWKALSSGIRGRLESSVLSSTCRVGWN